MRNFLLTALLLLASISAFAKDIKIQKVTTIGDLKHKVIFQSLDVKNVGNSYIEGIVVARWGTEVFEIANVYYKCDANLYCKFNAYKTIGTYKYCEVISGASRVVCEKKISGKNNELYARDISTSENPDEVYDEYNQGRNSDYYYPEFPVRIEDEFSGIGF